MKYFVTTGDATLEVLVEAAPGAEGSFVVTVDGVTRIVDCRTTGSRELSLLIDGEVETYLFSGAGGIDVTAHGGLFAYPMVVEDERQHLEAEIFGGRGKARTGAVCSVMPGIIVEVLVEVGQEVQGDEPLVVMEAMKMQNEVRSEGAGTVTAVHVKAGDTVDSGQALVDLE